jgi:hypothetical protein
MAGHCVAESFTSMGKRLGYLRNYSSFHQRAAHGTLRCVLRIFQAGKIASCSDIRIIDLWRLNQPFSDVGVVWPQNDNLIGRLNHGEPGFNGFQRNAKIPGQNAQADELVGS